MGTISNEISRDVIIDINPEEILEEISKDKTKEKIYELIYYHIDNVVQITLSRAQAYINYMDRNTYK